MVGRMAALAATDLGAHMSDDEVLISVLRIPLAPSHHFFVGALLDILVDLYLNQQRNYFKWDRLVKARFLLEFPIQLVLE